MTIDAADLRTQAEENDPFSQRIDETAEKQETT